jgi:hypothetical protein
LHKMVNALGHDHIAAVIRALKSDLAIRPIWHFMAGLKTRPKSFSIWADSRSVTARPL